MFYISSFSAARRKAVLWGETMVNLSVAKPEILEEPSKIDATMEVVSAIVSIDGV